MPETKTKGIGAAIISGPIIGLAIYVGLDHFTHGTAWFGSIGDFITGLIFLNNGGELGWFAVWLCNVFGWVASSKMFVRTVRYTNWAICSSCHTKYTLANNSRCPNCGSDIYNLY